MSTYFYLNCTIHNEAVYLSNDKADSFNRDAMSRFLSVHGSKCNVVLENEHVLNYANIGRFQTSLAIYARWEFAMETWYKEGKKGDMPTNIYVANYATTNELDTHKNERCELCNRNYPDTVLNIEFPGEVGPHICLNAYDCRRYSFRQSISSRS